MTPATTWPLIDVAHNLAHSEFTLPPTAVGWPVTHPTPVQLRTLHGGLRAGVQTLALNNGHWSVTVLPTRGLGLWCGQAGDVRLGWDAPVQGPVHPQWVNLEASGGIGFLAGFDEWLCRCGLASNGPPGRDEWSDAAGQRHTQALVLHGHIANRPAHLLTVEWEPTQRAIRVTGQVDEGGLFLPNLRLTTTYTLTFDSPTLTITDVVENRADQPTPMQMLYHLNFGPPLLEAGAKWAVPIRALAPQTARAAAGLDTFATYGPPEVGFAEQVYLVQPLADASGQTLALLHNAAGTRGVRIGWHLEQLPCFTVWKNTAGQADGYVTGLEPATNFPNFRGFERQHGRVRTLGPHQTWQATWTITPLLTPDAVAATNAAITAIQAQAAPQIHRQPGPPFAPG
jgi:galactose mutarotase-like enzyme